MAPPLCHLRLLAPPLRLLLGAIWRIARQQAHKHYGMIEDFIAVATEAVPDLLSIKEKSVLLSALRTKMFLSDPDPCHLDWTKDSTVTDVEWQRSMSCLTDAVAKGLDPQTLNEVFGREFDAALESLLSHFLSRLQQRLPVPDFTKVSDLLEDDWLTDCLQEVKTEELKELLTNHSTAQRPTCPDGESASEVVLKSAWQQLLHLQKIQGSKPTNQKGDQLNIKEKLPRATNQRPAHLLSPNQTPATANQAQVVTLFKLLPNQTTLLLIPTNQSTAPLLPTNQRTAPLLLTNQSTAPLLSTNRSIATVPPTNHSTATLHSTNHSTATLHSTNHSTATLHSTNHSTATVLQTNQQRRSSKRRRTEKNVEKSTNQEPPFGQMTVSDQSEPDSSVVTDQSKTVSTEDPPPDTPQQDSVSQNSQRLAQKCPLCNKCFIYRNQVLRHLETSRSCSSAPEDVRSLCCFQCSAQFQSKSALRTHLRTHRAQHPVLLKSIPTDQTQLVPDQRSETTVSEDQPRVVPVKASKAIVRKRGPPKETVKKLPLSCSLCEQSFKTQALLLSHLDDHLVRGDTPRYECVYCDQSFTGSTVLRIHQRTHVPRPFSCDVCGKDYSSELSLTSHKKSHGEKRFLCHTCGRGFVSRNGLDVHSRVHSDKTFHTCTICGRGFRFRPALRMHMRRHLGVRPYSCTVCGKSFHSSGDLYPHMRIHTGERPYSCKQCGQSFVVSSHLRLHLRKHAGEKPHSCPKCDKKFFQRKDLDQHLRVHSNERPFTCSHCPKAYTCGNHLRRHLQTHKAGSDAELNE